MSIVAADFQKMSLFSNQLLKVVRTYDFTKDTGAIDVYELMEASEDMVIVQAYTKVKVAVLSAGAPTVDIGITSDPNAIMVAQLKAALSLNAIIDGAAASQRLRIPSGEKLLLEIKVAVLTAGKLEVELLLAKF